MLLGSRAFRLLTGVDIKTIRVPGEPHPDHVPNCQRNGADVDRDDDDDDVDDDDQFQGLFGRNESSVLEIHSLHRRHVSGNSDLQKVYAGCVPADI